MLLNEKIIDFVEQKSDLNVYKSLILERDNLKKEEMEYYLEYIRTFGELLEKRFVLQIECIKNKKIISICQSKKNRGDNLIILSDIEQEVEIELLEYYEELQTIREISQDKGQEISEYEFVLIKRKYKKLAMKIHPDMHPEYSNDVELMELWERVKTAYKCNDLESLEEVEILIMDYLKEHGKSENIHIENLEVKIKKLNFEIQNIITNDPYTYKFILEDKNTVNNKKEEIQHDIEEYEIYLNELLNKIQSFNIIKELVN